MISTQVGEDFLAHAEMIAERLEALSTDGAWTHEALPLSQGIRKNIAIFKGEMEVPPNTSLGQVDFFEFQLRIGSKRLEDAAKAGWTGQAYT